MFASAWISRRRQLLAAAAVLAPLAALPLAARADTACPTDTLASVMALGSCSIGDVSFDFTHALNGIPPYFAGPFAGDSGPGPAASEIHFTPLPDANMPGFSLAGSFIAYGGYSTRYGSGLNYAGSNYDQSLNTQVTAGGGRSIAGTSVTLDSVSVSNTGDNYSIAMAGFGNAYAYLQSDGTSQLSALSNFSQPLNGILLQANLRQWEASSDPAMQAGFDHVTLRVIEAPVPEPTTWALFAGGLLALGWRRRAAERRA